MFQASSETVRECVMRFVTYHDIKLVWLNSRKITIQALIKPKGDTFRVAWRQTIEEYRSWHLLFYL